MNHKKYQTTNSPMLQHQFISTLMMLKFTAVWHKIDDAK